MAQKSLPILNKVNTSMIWYSTYYFSYYKWLSSQSLYFLYFFNKITTYLEFFFFNLFWVPYYLEYMDERWKSYSSFLPLENRFFKPVTSYLIQSSHGLVVCNLFYSTSLARFQALGDKKEWELATYELEAYAEKFQQYVYYY